MPALATFLPQLALVLVPLVTAILAYKTARRHQLPPVASAAPAAPASGSGGTTLNGSFAIIRTCLERLQTLQTLYDEEHARAIRLEARLDECQKDQRRHAARQKKPSPAPSAAASPAPPLLPPTAGEVGLAPTSAPTSAAIPVSQPTRSRSGRRRRAQG